MTELTGRAKAEQLANEQRAHDREMKLLADAVGGRINQTISTTTDRAKQSEIKRVLKRADKYYSDNSVDKTDASYYDTDKVDMTLRQRRNKYILDKLRRLLPWVIGVVGAVAIVIAVTDYLLTKQRAKEEYAAHHDKCSSTTISLYNEAVTGDQDEMAKVKSTIESTKGWQGDANCVYMMTVEGIVNSRTSAVKRNYQLLEDLRKQGYKVDDSVNQLMTDDEINQYIQQAEQ